MSTPYTIAAIIIAAWWTPLLVLALAGWLRLRAEDRAARIQAERDAANRRTPAHVLREPVA